MVFVFDQLVYSSYQDGLVTSFYDRLKIIDSVNGTKQFKLYCPDKCTCSFAGNNDKKLLRYLYMLVRRKMTLMQAFVTIN